MWTTAGVIPQPFVSGVALAVAMVVSALSAAEPCRIKIVDQENGWPVPLVQLETNHHVTFVSDNAGVIAFDLPELMGTETWFGVRGHGYGVDTDGFGYSGVRLVPRPGETLSVYVKRELPGKRLGRLTGGGLFAESQKLGAETDWRESNVLGCDSVQNAVLNGQRFWLWGDTTLARYPLGRFHMTGAITSPQPIDRFEPPIRLRYDYFRNSDDVPRDLARMPGDGPTWLSGLVTLPDREGNQRLVATYSKIKGMLTEYEKGLCVWNETTLRFDRLAVVWRRDGENDTPPPMPQGHAVSWTDEEGEQWVLFGDPFPTQRCRATFEAWSSPGQWQPVDAPESVFVRDSDQTVRPHRGSIGYSDFLKKWVAIFTQMHGDRSHLGEIWFAESDSPWGPWGNATHVVTHDRYTFYNPKLHLDMVPSGSPILLFEGTYTSTFSRTSRKTPRHDYNQILYRIDLDQPPWASSDGGSTRAR